jgi:hypothetical protein
MAFTIATRGNAETCWIDWSACDPAVFRDNPMLAEAKACDLVRTIEDLSIFLDQSDILTYLDSPRVNALLEINKHLVPDCPEQTPRIYFDADGIYTMLEFHPGQDFMMYGYLPEIRREWFDQYTQAEFEHSLPDMNRWIIVPLKSMP